MGEPVDATVSELQSSLEKLRQLKEDASTSNAELNRILRAGPPMPAHPRRGGSRSRLTVKHGLGLLVSAALLVASLWWLYPSNPPERLDSTSARATAALPLEQPASTPSPTLERASPPSLSAIPAAPSPAPVPRPNRPGRPVPVLQPPGARPVAEPTEAHELALLRQALRLLRVDHDPAGAITVLDRYDATYPEGMLRTEAAIARVDGYLAGGNRADALATLERRTELGDETLPRALELRVVKAELLAAAGRCPEAIGVFGTAVESRPASTLAARAHLGRGRCRYQRGDFGGARADAQRVLVIESDLQSPWHSAANELLEKVSEGELR